MRAAHAILMLMTPVVPPTVAQHAIVWIMKEWNDPRRRQSMLAECDDVMHPYATHPDCTRIVGTYHEGAWFMHVSAQAMNSHQPVRVVVGTPTYTPTEENDQDKERLVGRIIKIPLELMSKI